MYQIMTETDIRVLAIRVRGTLNKADYDGLHSWLDDQLQRRPRPSVLVVMEDFEGWESISALLEDGKIDLVHQDDVQRVAMVGDKRWQKWMTVASQPLSKATIRYFDVDEIDAARAWLRDDAAHS
ncbi:MAG: STAS/SEC14 domain-containing protein [Alphaproteobacteria bacterium]|jgi:hypothetical protein|nr:STAS/SEC14 domain-containing protein [Alphaproteobacteria bacterium]MBU1552113.1 STAS/SEC14 domain-containing protein [Alphaproteobacteria bacterium]MBU2336362.1 STAS/SEC14 domain-containing protein [Alphaproteobacteria bacterium]MBU2388207.1 STAS/SEC14 domain-containing protein [Alphaproteobacteria bacterium]|tara:strand:- start:347 stop:721 length:375 start_codon:yes stop_codon:yes gene_type:complete